VSEQDPNRPHEVDELVDAVKDYNYIKEKHDTAQTALVGKRQQFEAAQREAEELLPQLEHCRNRIRRIARNLEAVK